MSEEQRLMVALVITMVIIFVFSYYFTSTTTPTTKDFEKNKIEKIERKGDNKDKTNREIAHSKNRTNTSPQIITLSTPKYSVKFSNLGASVIEYTLLEPKYKEKDKPMKIIEINDGPGAFHIRFFKGASDYNEASIYEIKKITKDSITFYYNTGNLEIKREFKLLPEYQLEIKTEIKNSSSEEQLIRYGIVTKERVTKDEQKDGLCLVNKDLIRRNGKDLIDNPITGVGKINFTGIDTLYFLNAISLIHPEEEVGCRVENDIKGRTIFAWLEFIEEKIEAGKVSSSKVIAYIGPKDYELLNKLDSTRNLEKAIDYGSLAFLCKILLILLKTFYKWTYNWGIAVILLTVLVKIILLPLTQKSYKSMKNLQEKMNQLKPLLDEINEKYANDKDLRTQKTMELYQRYGINPLSQLSGCLPMLLQMPIWIALYTTLAKSVELYHSPFFGWLKDLSQPDPYYILPILLGASMVVQQKITPSTTDSTQTKIMIWIMPAMFFFFMLKMPSGLTLYIFANTILSIIHQLIMDKFIYPKPKVILNKKEEKKIRSGLNQNKNTKKRR